MAAASVQSPLLSFPLREPQTPEKVSQYNDWHYAQRQGVVVCTPEDDALLRALLQPTDPKFQSPSTWVLAPQYKCLGCGKLAGFADSVYTALTDGVHSAAFMVHAIINDVPNKAPARCAGCGSPSPYMLGWAAGMGWTCSAGTLADKC
ncbi:hypothetical protein HG530_015779 [Fusarium avenaceum]|nr:hypothetical protein HG530_015779 [Fusarium avenaceum]